MTNCEKATYTVQDAERDRFVGSCLDDVMSHMTQ